MTGELRVGFARRDITPPPGIDLSGFGFRFGANLGSLEPLKVGALAVTDGAQTVLLFSLDLIGLTLDHLAHLRSRTASRSISVWIPVLSPIRLLPYSRPE